MQHTSMTSTGRHFQAGLDELKLELGAAGQRPSRRGWRRPCAARRAATCTRSMRSHRRRRRSTPAGGDRRPRLQAAGAAPAGRHRPAPHHRGAQDQHRPRAHRRPGGQHRRGARARYMRLRRDRVKQDVIPRMADMAQAMLQRGARRLRPRHVGWPDRARARRRARRACTTRSSASC